MLLQRPRQTAMGVQRKERSSKVFFEKFEMTRYREIFYPHLFGREWLLVLQLYNPDCITIDRQITLGIGEPCWELISHAVANVGRQ